MPGLNFKALLPLLICSSALVGCGGGSSDTTAAAPPGLTPGPTVHESTGSTGPDITASTVPDPTSDPAPDPVAPAPEVAQNQDAPPLPPPDPVVPDSTPDSTSTALDLESIRGFSYTLDGQPSIIEHNTAFDGWTDGKEFFEAKSFELEKFETTFSCSSCFKAEYTYKGLSGSIESDVALDAYFSRDYFIVTGVIGKNNPFTIGDIENSFIPLGEFAVDHSGRFSAERGNLEDRARNGSDAIVGLAGSRNAHEKATLNGAFSDDRLDVAGEVTLEGFGAYTHETDHNENVLRGIFVVNRDRKKE